MHDTKYLSLFFKGLGCKSLMMSSKWRVSFQKCMHCTKPSPSMQFERLFSWICYEMLVDKYENMNIESIYSILLYELTHLICWLKAYSSKLLPVSMRLSSVSVLVFVRVCICCLSKPLKMHSAQRSSLRKHSCSSRLHKHPCMHYIDKMLLCILYNFKTCTHCIHQNLHALLEWKCIKL